jgi:hypothetical protein
MKAASGNAQYILRAGKEYWGSESTMLAGIGSRKLLRFRSLAFHSSCAHVLICVNAANAGGPCSLIGE